MSEVLAQKITSLQRCVARAREARAEAGAILSREKAIAAGLGERLQKIVAVHQYRDLDVSIVESVITRYLDDLLEFAQMIRVQMDGSPKTDNG